jgi:hypothetical protein
MEQVQQRQVDQGASDAAYAMNECRNESRARGEEKEGMSCAAV